MSNTITLDKKFEMAYNCAVNIIKRRNASGANVKYSVGYEDINPFEEERAIGSILSTLNIDQLTQIAKLAIEQKKSEQYQPRKDAADFLLGKCRMAICIKEKETTASC